MSKGPNRVNYESKSQVLWLKAREERRLRMLRRIFGPRMGEVKGEWRKLHNGELNDLYSSPSIAHVIKSRRMRWVTHSAHIGAYRVLVGKPERKRPLGRPRHRWEDNIKVNLQEVGCGGDGLDRAGTG